jgi:hypothetical protein
MIFKVKPDGWITVDSRDFEMSGRLGSLERGQILIVKQAEGGPIRFPRYAVRHYSGVWFWTSSFDGSMENVVTIRAGDKYILVEGFEE